MTIKKNTPHFLRHTGLSFTTIINQTMDSIDDPASLGIYCYLASKPDNWEINNKELQNRFNKGFDFVKKRLADLREKGLIRKSCVRNETTGQIIRWEIVLVNYQEGENPSSSESRRGKTQRVENPPGGKIEPNNNIYIEIKDNINNISATKVAPDFDDIDSDEDYFEYEEIHAGDYSNNQTNISIIEDKPSEAKMNSDKSDYFENQSNNKNTKCGTKTALTLKDLEADNPFNLPREMLSDWITNRNKKRAPITRTAWNRICKELEKCKDSGVDPVEAFETMVASGWQSLNADWVKNRSCGSYQSLKTQERLANDLKIRERELKAYQEKRKEIEAAKQYRSIMASVGPKISLAERLSNFEKSFIASGMTKEQYHQHLTSRSL